MANITLLGASYTDVPAVDLPQTGGGTVRFYEDSNQGLYTVEKIKSYIVEESWENDTKGNPVAIQNALGINISELTNCSESFLCIFRNNNATNANYRVDLIQYAKDSSSNHYGSYSVRGNVSAARGASTTNVSLWASVGTIIDVYKVKINL